MLTDKHYDFKNEKNYLDETVKVLDTEVEYLANEIEKSDEELSGLKKRVGGNYSDELIAKLTIHDSYERKLKMLKRAENKPYFGRIDFKELGKENLEQFYIGKTSVTRREDDRRFVIDWRTPLASLYYSGEIGDVMYTAPDGLIMGELSLKRQYEIANREIMNIFDKGLTPMDEYLQDALWQKKDNRLRDIVTTIQREQDDIIRADENKVIIVQGVAGSGKTTIVLHRIAYLMYTYQEMFQPEKLLIIVPNRLFLNYISDVLPDLGVEEINQTTFEDLTMKILDMDIKLSSSEDKFYKLLSCPNSIDSDNEKLKFISWFKGSLLFKDILDTYIADLAKQLSPKKELKVCEYTIFSQKEIIDMYNIQYSYLPLIPRLKRIEKYVKDNIKNRMKVTLEKIRIEYDNKIKRIKSEDLNEEELRQKHIEIYDERDNEMEKLNKSSMTSVTNYFKGFSDIDIAEIYKNIIRDKEVLSKYTKEKVDEKYCDFI